MKHIKAGLNDNVVTSYNNGVDTFVSGRVAQKTVEGELVIGPPLNRFADVFTDSGVVAAISTISPNGRIFSLTAEASGLARLVLHEQNIVTGAITYVGQVNIALPDTAATTTTYRSVKVIDAGTSGWKIFITTIGSVLINGGTFVVNNLARTDFVPIGFANIPFATGNNQKAVYFLQDPALLGAAHPQVTSVGSLIDLISNLLYVHHGLSATHQYYVFDTSASLNYSSDAITGTEATNTINHAGHTFNNGDQITFLSLTGGAGLVVGTVYFVRDSVPGVSYSVSATTGGAAINFTTDISVGTVGRAFGITGSAFLHKTGNLPALAGVLLLTDSEDYATPDEGVLAGETCAFLATNSTLYMGKLSELTVGATTWPSLQSANLLGTPNEIVAPAATHALWSNALKRAIYASAGPVLVVKKFVSNQIEIIFGGNNNRYLEALVGNDVVQFQAQTLLSLNTANGYIMMLGGATGQRGNFLFDLQSNYQFNHGQVITKVLDVYGSSLSFVSTLDKLFDFTGSLVVSYRTSGFDDVDGGWIDIPFSEDISSFASGDQIQFRICWDTAALDTSIHAQLVDFVLGFASLNEISDFWEFSFDDSQSGTPSRAAFRLKKTYESAVPQLSFRAYDTDNVLVVNHNTVSNSGNFQYSTDGGQSWSALGTIPNTVGTLLRYTFASQPGTDIRPSLRES